MIDSLEIKAARFAEYFLQNKNSLCKESFQALNSKSYIDCSNLASTSSYPSLTKGRFTYAHEIGHIVLSQQRIIREFKRELQIKAESFRTCLDRIKLWDVKPSFINEIKRLKLEELVELLNQVKQLKKSIELELYLKFLISKKEAADRILRLIRKIDQLLNYFVIKNLHRRRNKRFYFRNVQAFRFKNLDDYHDFSVNIR